MSMVIIELIKFVYFSEWASAWAFEHLIFLSLFLKLANSLGLAQVSLDIGSANY